MVADDGGSIIGLNCGADGSGMPLPFGPNSLKKQQLKIFCLNGN